MKRVVIFKNGLDVDGKVVMITHSMEDLISVASKKCGIFVSRIFTAEGGEIDEIDLIRDNDILYASAGEPFIPLESKNENKREKEKSCSFPCATEGEWVTLNVGGEYFITSRSTLIMKEPCSVLAKMFSPDNGGFQPSERDANGAYLIDRSPTYFKPLLNYLRTNEVIIDSGVNPYGVLEEAKYFNIESMIPQIEKIATYSHYNRDNIPLTRRDVVNALIATAKDSQLRFQGVNLAGADLSKLDLRFINFKYANLKGCRLVGTNLSFCTMERADLSQATLDNAQLLGVKMLCANLEGASLRGCNFEDPAGTNANMEAVNLKGSDLEGSNMAGVHLRVATLKNANLKHCDLRAAVLAGADLENCDLTGSNLQEANLRGANLKGASLELMQAPVHMSQTVA